MGFSSNSKWSDIIRARILGLFGVQVSDGDDSGEGGEAGGPESNDSSVQAVPESASEARPTDSEYVSDPPPPLPAMDTAPQVLGHVSDGTSIMYVQTCFWVAAYVQQRAAVGDFTHDQLIEQFGVNVRRCINPEWRANG